MQKIDPQHYLNRFLQLHPKRIDLTLGRIERLLAKLGNPHLNIPPVIHVAGTNGKGSTIAYLNSILIESGYKVHRYISPHLVKFNERIQIANREIDDEALCDLLAYVEKINDGSAITFFEITTATAFMAFSGIDADLTLVEVGLGGRFDATNVIANPLLSLITPVSLDHQEFLGKQYKTIAQEKSGIIKYRCATMSALQKPSAQKVIMSKALQMQSPLYIEGRDYKLDHKWGGHSNMMQLKHALGPPLILPKPSLRGGHQLHNAALAVMASLFLSSHKFCAIDQHKIREGLSKTQWPARLQPLNGGHIARSLGASWHIICDGGHNIAAGRVLHQYFAKQRDQNATEIKHIALVGMLSNKDALGFLSQIACDIDLLIGVEIDNHQSISMQQYMIYGKKLGVETKVFQNLEKALDGLKQISETEFGRVHLLICGSLYLAGEVLKIDQQT